MVQFAGSDPRTPSVQAETASILPAGVPMQSTSIQLSFAGMALIGIGILLAAGVLVWMFSSKRRDD